MKEPLVVYEGGIPQAVEVEEEQPNWKLIGGAIVESGGNRDELRKGA